jgi:ribosomal protein S18 acetylase RimI-like enzyme
MTIHFSDRHICLAAITDAAGITLLLNSAYRGESSKQGWTTEAHLIAGNARTNETDVQQLIQQSGSILLLYRNEENNILGCVNLQQQAHKIYLGMLSVSPQLQGGGIGKKLLAAAEEYAAQQQCNTIYMTVISARTELIDWYKRHGYTDTGERKPFVEDAVSGKHLQPLEFLVMSKKIALVKG